ncbi:MAG: bifunctional aspartate kinase/homoserine dehydrogenase I, partial [Tunicatimonas sp.]
LANSKKMLLREAGIAPGEWRQTLEGEGETSNIQSFVAQMQRMNLPNSVFVDCTSSEAVVKFYPEVLQSAISIVTPNKLANSRSYADYQQLKQRAMQAGVKFLYETNVGAGLPVIRVLQDLKDSGDRVHKIEGVLSGTLSYLFNSFTEGITFSDVVRQAREKGFTEPDPRDDLNGMDVARKILILAREIGVPLELSDVTIENILPEACQQAPSVEAFFGALQKNDTLFEERRQQAEAAGQRLRFIATLEDQQASVRLVATDPSHPFYTLSGSDNVISYTTDRYRERPLVVKGPGAGAEVTAAGVFADLISISNYLYQDY